MTQSGCTVLTLKKTKRKPDGSEEGDKDKGGGEESEVECAQTGARLY